MHPLVGLGCLIFYVVGRLFRKPKFLDDEISKNFRRDRDEALGNISILKKVKKMK